MQGVFVSSEGGYEILVTSNPENPCELVVYLFHEVFDDPIVEFPIPLRLIFPERYDNGETEETSK